MDTSKYVPARTCLTPLIANSGILCGFTMRTLCALFPHGNSLLTSVPLLLVFCVVGSTLAALDTFSCLNILPLPIALKPFSCFRDSRLLCVDRLSRDRLVFHLFNLPDVCPSSCAPLATDCELHHPSSTSCSSSQRNLGGTKDLKDQKEMPGKRVVYRAADDLYSFYPRLSPSKRQILKG
jgi:hypothetical protein